MLKCLDYAVEIFLKAIKKEPYKCYLKEDSRLPMVYISDCLDGIVKILEASSEKLKQRVYNINAIDFTPSELESEISKQLKSPMQVSYESDFRQAIADSWPASLNDANSRNDWGWNPKIDSTEKLVGKMLQNLQSIPGTENQ